MDEIIQIKIRDLNPHIVCSLCAGYFIDATTITECLHTFCKSCVVKFLHTSKCCPQCGQKVHETQPLQNLKADRVLQDIIFKIVPGLYENERKRIEEFDGPGSREETMVSNSVVNLVQNDNGSENDRMVCFSLVNYRHLMLNTTKNSKDDDSDGPHLVGKFIQSSERTYVINIKDFVRKYFNLGPVRVDILSGHGVPLEDWTTLRKLWLMKNPHNKADPFKLYYRIFEDH